MIGFDANKKSKLFLTDPSGINSEWRANAIGRNSKNVLEFLEKSFVENMTSSETVKLTVKALLEVVQSGAKSMEIAVMNNESKVTVSVV